MFYYCLLTISYFCQIDFECLTTNFIIVMYHTNDDAYDMHSLQNSVITVRKYAVRNP